jgi:hypothetical protein
MALARVASPQGALQRCFVPPVDFTYESPQSFPIWVHSSSVFLKLFIPRRDGICMLESVLIKGFSVRLSRK